MMVGSTPSRDLRLLMACGDDLPTHGRATQPRQVTSVNGRDAIGPTCQYAEDRTRSRTFTRSQDAFTVLWAR